MAVSNKKDRIHQDQIAKSAKLALAAAIAPGSLGQEAKKAVVHSDIRHADLKVAGKGIQANRRRAKHNRGAIQQTRLAASTLVAVD